MANPETLANSLNNPTTVLTSAVAAGDATLPVRAPATPDAWPTTGPFRILVDAELIQVTAGAGNATSLSVVARGVEGTTAAAHVSGSSVDLVFSAAGVLAATVAEVSPVGTIASGALPTAALSSGVGSIISAARDVETVTPVTFNPTGIAAATCKVELAPPDLTYSTLVTWSIPAGVSFDGTVYGVKVRVPAGWSLKLTVVNAVLGTTTYY